MTSVLLVTPLGAQAANAEAYAIERARAAGVPLVVVVVLGSDRTQRVAAALTDEGWVGERVSDGVVAIVERQQHAEAEACGREVVARAEAAGVTASVRIETGDPGDVCVRAISQCNAGAAVLVTEKPSWVTRFLSRGAAVRLPALAGCDVRIMDD